jgi:hypothetical protein
MLVDERPLLVYVALVANGISTGQGAHLAHSSSAVWVMAVAALDEAFVDPVVIGFGKI